MERWGEGRNQCGWGYELGLEMELGKGRTTGAGLNTREGAAGKQEWKELGGRVHLGRVQDTEPRRGYTENRAVPWGQSDVGKAGV